MVSNNAFVSISSISIFFFNQCQDEGQARAFTKTNVYIWILLRCLKASVEVAGIWMAVVKTNQGIAAGLCMSASRAAVSCSQMNSGNLGMAVRAHTLGEAEWGQDCSTEAHWKGLAWENNRGGGEAVRGGKGKEWKGKGHVAAHSHWSKLLPICRWFLGWACVGFLLPPRSIQEGSSKPTALGAADSILQQLWSRAAVMGWEATDSLL